MDACDTGHGYRLSLWEQECFCEEARGVISLALLAILHGGRQPMSVRRRWTCSNAAGCFVPGFRVLEMGAGTGGLTKDALPLLDTDLHHELLRYCATDITSAFSTGLIEAVKSPKLVFKARPLFIIPRACCWGSI